MFAGTQRLSLSVKAALFVAVATIVIVLSFTILSVFADRYQHTRDLIHRAETLGDTTASLAADATAVLNFQQLERLIEEVVSQPDIAYAFVVNANARYLADSRLDAPSPSERSTDSLVAQVLAEGESLCVTSRRMAEIAIPILRNGRLEGVLRLAVSMESVNARTRQNVLRSFWFGMLALALTAPLASWAVGHVVNPVRALTQAAARVAERDFSVRTDVKTNDEIQDLSEAFNAMVGELHESLNRIKWLAYMDDLTRLPNKTVFVEQAGRRLRDATTPGAILLINLDRFKRLNDTFGAAAGDQILIAAADRLRMVAQDLRRRFDHPDAHPPLLARLSGDEFALLLCGPAPTGLAKHCGDAIIAALREPITIASQQVTLSASVGMARFPFDAADADHLLRHANLALDAAKADGGSSYRFFEPEMTRRAVERVTLEHELRRAVANRDFVVFYQPKIDARTGAVVGCESLVRWRREGKIVGPNIFIEAAEESGLIADIGEFVLQESCQAAANWTAEGLHAHVAVNVSAVQFDRDDFTRVVMRAVRDSGVSPELLELELTESIAMNAPERVLAQIEPLRAKGVRFAIDDFGTGYSSLSTLTRLPFDVFKIDQSFVRGMDRDKNARVVVETILAMARALGYDTVAEGVETEAHFAFLRMNGCTHAQGYLFGKPMPLEEFLAFLRRDSRPIPVPRELAAPTVDVVAAPGEKPGDVRRRA